MSKFEHRNVDGINDSLFIQELNSRYIVHRDIAEYIINQTSKYESALKMLEEMNNELLWIGDNTKESRIRKVADTMTDKYREWEKGKNDTP